MNPNLKAFVMYFKRGNLPRCFISTHLCMCVCVYISQLVYMYIIYIKHLYFYIQVCFYYTDNKDGGRFLFFS